MQESQVNGDVVAKIQALKEFTVASELMAFLLQHHYHHSSGGMDFPGGRVMFTSEMNFIPASQERRVPCFRILSDDVNSLSSSHDYHLVSKEMLVNIYRKMVSLQVMDSAFWKAQGEGKVSTLGRKPLTLPLLQRSPPTTFFALYREPGVLLWRGFSFREFANHCFGNKADYSKGRQMPVHYGSHKLRYFTISSPLATQLPQAVGAAYSLKMDKKDACDVAYFGDGTTSEGNFHAALNFAAVMEAPVVFICRNNGWAVSTPVHEQFRSDGIVVKGHGYGLRSIRVDGNDALAVYNVTKKAREMAVHEQRPILVEALTYRVGRHSTSDDFAEYRPIDEIEEWKTVCDPLPRLRSWIERNGWWEKEDEDELRNSLRKEVNQAIQAAESVEKPHLSDLFNDVYHQPTQNLVNQETDLANH
ncbi:hypothetical protein V2J09_007642 [Rumex salicifolius]